MSDKSYDTKLYVQGSIFNNEISTPGHVLCIQCHKYIVVDWLRGIQNSMKFYLLVHKYAIFIAIHLSFLNN